MRGAAAALLTQRLPAPTERVSALLLGLRPGSSLPRHWRDPPSVRLDIPPLCAPPTPPAVLLSVGLLSLPFSASLPHKRGGGERSRPFALYLCLWKNYVLSWGTQELREASLQEERVFPKSPGQPHTHPPLSPTRGESLTAGSWSGGRAAGPAGRDSSMFWGQPLLLKATSSLQSVGWGHAARPGPGPRM